MRDLRKIYRAQYLQRLAEVTEEERQKQLQLYLQEQRERRKRREELLERLYEDRKRRAVLKDRLRVEKKVTQALQTARVSRRKVGRLLWLQKLQKAADFMQQQEEAAATVEATTSATRRRREREGHTTAAVFADEELYEAEALLKAKDQAFRTINNRNISVPDLLKELGQNDEQVKSIKKKITGTDNVFREIMEESFALLPEDAPEYDEEGGLESQRERSRVLSDRERAAITYAGFSESEKIKLLEEKIAMLNRKLDDDYALRGGPQSLMYVQLRDHLQAAKIAYQEQKYVEETERRLRQERDTHRSSEDSLPTSEVD